MSSDNPASDRPAADSEAVKTHLEDLQSEMKAGARKLTVLADELSVMREAILHRHLDQAAISGALIRRVRAIQESVRRQQEQLRELRRAIRERREQATIRRKR